MTLVRDPRTAQLEGFFLSPEPAQHSTTLRTVLVAAHPDDETIGAGGLLSRRKNFKVVHATDGSPLNPSDALVAGCSTRESYAEIRRKEAVDALASVGIGEDAITNLRFTDQRASFHLRELSELLQALVERLRPEIVLTHAYEGGHPDHDSVAFACHMAQRVCRPEARFQLCEFTGYHAANGGMEVYRFLPDEEHEQYIYRLSAEERELKISMITKFATQGRTLQPFSSPEVERFRVAPDYDFTRPPHEGKLWYENFNWGVDGMAWRKMASQTLREIFHP
jgi:LmbE family N-acetylglucosaminyl deacetylase